MGSRFTIAEVMLGGLLTLLTDATAALLDFLEPWTVGIIMTIGIILQSAVSFGTSWWLAVKGGKRAWRVERQLIKQVSNFLPVVPTTFTAFIIEVIIHNIKSRGGKEKSNEKNE